MLERLHPMELQKLTEELIATFPSEMKEVQRAVRSYSKQGENSTFTYTVVFSGEILVIPPGGSVQRFGLGQVENYDLGLLLTGQADVNQGDFLIWNDPGVSLSVLRRQRLYQITGNPTWMGGTMFLQLKQYQQAP